VRQATEQAPQALLCKASLARCVAARLTTRRAAPRPTQARSGSAHARTHAPTHPRTHTHADAQGRERAHALVECGGAGGENRIELRRELAADGTARHDRPDLPVLKSYDYGVRPPSVWDSSYGAGGAGLHMHTRANAHTHTRTQTHTRARTHTRTETHTRSRARKRAHRMHARKCTRTHVSARAAAHAHTRARAHHTATKPASARRQRDRQR
jgi:hypothetical protein